MIFFLIPISHFKSLKKKSFPKATIFPPTENNNNTTELKPQAQGLSSSPCLPSQPLLDCLKVGPHYLMFPSTSLPVMGSYSLPSKTSWKRHPAFQLFPHKQFPQALPGYPLCFTCRKLACNVHRISSSLLAGGRWPYKWTEAGPGSDTVNHSHCCFSPTPEKNNIHAKSFHSPINNWTSN